MKYISFLCLFILCLSNVTSKLEFVIEVFRHGAREPIGPPNDAYQWEETKGELTSTGMRQHYLLGVQMRKRYIEETGFLSSNYNKNEFYVRSTDVNRTISSALSQLYGFYPLGTGPTFTSDFPLNRAVPPYRGVSFDIEELGMDVFPNKYQPIPIHIVNEDYLLRSGDYCPAYEKLHKAQKKSSQYKEFNKHFKSFFSKVGDVFNVSDVSHWSIGDVADYTSDTYCDIYENKKIPEKLTKEIWNTMDFIKQLETQFVDMGNDMETKILSTPFLQSVLYLFDNKINKNQKDFPLKYVMLSAHDTTVAPFINALNLTSWTCIWNKWNNNKDESVNCEAGYPVFASQLLLELHSNKDGFFVKAIYNGMEMNLCEKNQKECDFDEFRQRLENYVLDDYDETCGISNRLNKKGFLSWNSKKKNFIFE